MSKSKIKKFWLSLNSEPKIKKPWFSVKTSTLMLILWPVPLIIILLIWS